MDHVSCKTRHLRAAGLVRAQQIKNVVAIIAAVAGGRSHARRQVPFALRRRRPGFLAHAAAVHQSSSSPTPTIARADTPRAPLTRTLCGSRDTPLSSAPPRGKATTRCSRSHATGSGGERSTMVELTLMIKAPSALFYQTKFIGISTSQRKLSFRSTSYNLQVILARAKCRQETSLRLASF